MTITINLPNPALKQRASAAKTHVQTHVQACVEHARYEHMIRKSQKKIGPHIP
jgi:hypothetical protein